MVYSKILAIQHRHWLLLLCGGLLLADLSAAIGAEPLQLTTDHLYKRDPVFVEEGRAIVFVLLERPEQLRLMRLDMKTKAVKPLHPDETRTELEPAFSPDGRFYAFLQNKSPASVGLVIRETKGEKNAEIPPASGFAGMRSPAFSPDGSRILFALAEGGRQQIWSVTTGGKDRKNIIDSPGINNWASYSPDGRRIVFGSTRDGNYELYTMDVGTSKIRRLTESPSQDIRPRFSPDGRSVSFTSNRDGNYEIYLLDIETTSVRRITNHPERDDYAAWHPDGKHLVMVSERRGKHDLYLVELP